MSFANSSITDIIASTMQSRNRVVADNVTKNNAVLTWLQKNGRIKTISGGNVILEELSFAENGNGGAYSGSDLLPVASQDMLSAASFNIKQYAVPVSINGLEELQNSGKEAMFDLLEARLAVSEGTMKNLLCQGIYGDGTGYNGKAITGLDAADEATLTASQTSTYGGISRATWSFWRNYCPSVTQTDISSAVKCQTVMNVAWASLIRGLDRPDLILMDDNFWGDWTNSLQALQRFTSPSEAVLGFATMKYMTADVVLDGGIGGFAGQNVTTPSSTGTAYFLNTKFLKWRPHKDRNMVPIGPNRRYAVNQDASVAILGFAGNLTCSGARFQGRINATTI